MEVPKEPYPPAGWTLITANGNVITYQKGPKIRTYDKRTGNYREY
jgi:hypothetical protein